MNDKTLAARAELLLPYQLRERIAARPVAYLPLGTIEWHCEHLPVGLDALTAHGLSLASAGRDGGIVLPPLFFGTGGGHSSYPFTVMMDDEREIAALLRKSLSRLQDFGLRLAVLLSGNFADTQLAMIDRIAADWNRNLGPLQVLATAVNRIEGLPIGPDHAGLFETTLLSALQPELVRIDRLPAMSEAPLPPGDGDFSPTRHDPRHPIWGVFGPDPRRFDPATAAGLLSSSANWLVGEVRKALS